MSHFQILIQKCHLAASNVVCPEMKGILLFLFHENEAIYRFLFDDIAVKRRITVFMVIFIVEFAYFSAE